MLNDIIFTALIVPFSGVFFGILSCLFLFNNGKKRAENRNDRGSVALIIMGIMLAAGLVSFVVHDAARDQKTKTVQVSQSTKGIDPNGME